jgi:hypothetical protein
MRQEQVKSRRVEFKQGLIYPDGVISNVNGAEEPGIEVPKTVTG